MEVGTYTRMNGEVRIEAHLGNRRHSLSPDEAMDLAGKLLGAVAAADLPDKHGIWYLVAGAEPGQVVGHVTGTLLDAKVVAIELAKKHGSVIWALSVIDVTGILAYPPCPRCGHSSFEQIEVEAGENRGVREVMVHSLENGLEDPQGEVPAHDLEGLGALIKEASLTPACADGKDLAYYVDLPYEIALTPDEDGGWVATIPLLKGCISWGETEPEAEKNIREAQKLWLDVALENGWAIPEPAES